MAVRMKDVAQSLGVSIVTVSKALKNHPDIAKATRERVMAKIKEVNYRPNLMARSLVTGRSSLVGLIVPDLIHPFFSEIAKSLSSALRKKDFFLLVASSESDAVLEDAEIEHMLAHRLDALVVATTQSTSEKLRKVSENGPPLILLDRDFLDFRSNFLGSNDYKVGELATEHLIAIGRKKIAHIRGPENRVGKSRFEGYQHTLERHGVAIDPRYVIAPLGSVDVDGRRRGETAMKHLLSLKMRPDAVFCFNDMIASGAMMAALDAGLKIPRDLAVIGCGNYHYDELLRVPLSTIDQRIEPLGLRTAKMIFRLVEAEGPIRPQRVILEPELVVRESSRVVK
ncbi:LacI family DNA-binding transcriptional regulator [Tunturiibacter empetritectus]|uniref:LacI family transcriptional regulator n=2 Tax=Tunturiibacter TaxID=3154218 RepID=A0A852VL92_9BACT|nr:LacI family DNA-binding transcriptional regulator [Edaphobacter lichenicola]NYF90202.1 LacI family transcriptional regulator [Edaphobacter lichenicola]